MAGDDPMDVEVVVGLVTNPGRRVLLTFNERWGAFTLPMTRRRRGREGNEPLTRAAFRAAGEALGVPVRLVQDDPRRLAGRLQSARQMVDKHYRYDVFHVEPHPDFDDRLQIRQPHLWLSPHMVLAGAYEPISESARTILRGTLKDFGIPARVQHASVVIVHRDDPERGRQFLVRWDPDWGYALPAKRWDHPVLGERRRTGPRPPWGPQRSASSDGSWRWSRTRTSSWTRPGRPSSPRTASARPARCRPSVRQRIITTASSSRGSAIPRSSGPSGPWPGSRRRRSTTAGRRAPPACRVLPAGFAARISHTAEEVLGHLGLIAEAVDPEVEQIAGEWLASQESGRR